MTDFGLLGKNISYSFSESYFKIKFEDENIKDTFYKNFDIKSIAEFPSILKNNANLKGLNVTIPYKEAVIPFLDKIDKKAEKIGAVNTIKITKKGKLKGYNTDFYGFKKSLKPFLKSHHKRALILGTGGASKAVAFSLKRLDIPYTFVSREASKKKAPLTYNSLTEDILSTHEIIINCTPLGTFPDINHCPNIPYKAITEKHILFDLIYNPEETLFLKKGKQQKATTINGYEMLKLQAEKSWKIWNS
ncbi:shikimate dehydrogenase family protein [Corallibacter sp.]|uniref:shikimate dehydrogenase family protein n=1 Tax=Corallibacter sp. TaxID=2038084 RepID=UPI003AB8E82C